MSGFCGQFNRDGRPAVAGELTPAMDALAHHGRHGHGLWVDGPVAFGHQMTHVTPESVGETLPCHQPSPSLAITGDFRLDNRPELLAQLAVPRELRPATPDSAVVLLAYERWRAGCVDRLLGDFAFAIWDETTQQLFCARDFIGVKPFYYHLTADGFSFASDITALLAFPAPSNELNLRYVRTYLEHWDFYHTEFSFLRDVRKLPPGHTLAVSAGDLRKTRYWQPQDSPEIRLAGDEEYIEQMRALLEEAVHVRLRSAFPVAGHLSGGLDSSSITVLAARALRERGDPFHGFSWSPPPSEADFPLADERAWVQAVCRAEGIVPVYTPFGPEDVVKLWTWDLVRWPMQSVRKELPTGRIAQSLGIRVMLSGWGGDEGAAFNGRGYFADLLRRGHWVTLLRELALRTRIHEDDFWGTFRSRAILPLLPDALVRRYRPELMIGLPDPLPLELLQPSFAERLASVEPYPTPDARERPGARRYQYRLFQRGHITDRLESWADLGGHRGIEYRYPLLDRRVVEFALGVPVHLFHRHGWKRYLFRSAVHNIVPGEVQWKKYKGEPAAARNYQTALEGAGRLLFSVLEGRRTIIQQAGYLQADSFLKAVKGLADGLEGGKNARRVLWLAQLD